MIHVTCKRKVVLDVSGRFKLVSPGIAINSKGIMPGTMELIAPNSTVSKNNFFCPHCEVSMSEEKEIDEGILFPCDLCSKDVKPSTLHILQSQTKICSTCIGIIEKGDSKDKLYQFFSSKSISSKNYRTLLQVIVGSK